MTVRDREDQPERDKADRSAGGPRDLVRASTDLLVLSVLEDGPCYGYAIIKKVAARSEGAIRLTPGVLYPLLHQMEKQKLLLSSWETVQAADNDDPETGRKRKWYRLSAKGRRRLEQRAAAHRRYQRLIESFLPSPGRGERRDGGEANIEGAGS